MIFEDFFKALKKSDLLTQAMNDSTEMFKVAFEMFEDIAKQVFEKYDDALFDEIKRKDEKLNHFEKSIKKKVFEHVTVSEKVDQDLYSSFLIYSVANDIERLGDYCKNINEVSQVREKLVNEELNKITREYFDILRLDFKDCLKVYTEDDKELASKVIDSHYKLKSNIDDLLDDLACRKIENNENLVIYALFLRYMKRLSAHLMNIATAVKNPINMIGYYVGDKKDEE